MSCFCGEPVKAKGFCSRHYLADYRQRKLQGPIKEKEVLNYKEKPDNKCWVETCNSPIRAKRVCTKHYFQIRRAS